MRTFESSRQVTVLRDAGVSLAPGLSEDELRAAEERVGARFPPDLRELLFTALPVGERFPDWRALDSARLRTQLDWPFEGIRFDIERNVFWWPAWGARPHNLDEAIAVAREHFQSVPRLIPVYAHRYLPAEPCLAGNPVLSVYQLDIIVYGANLTEYFANEFRRDSRERVFPTKGASRQIRFCSEVMWSDEALNA